MLVVLIWTLIFKSCARNKLNCLSQLANSYLVWRKISLEGKIWAQKNISNRRCFCCVWCCTWMEATWTLALPDHHKNINHTLPSCVCSLIPSGTHTQTIGISAASLNPVWDVGMTREGGGKGGWYAFRRFSHSYMGGERACVFPGKKTEESILGTGGIQ